jgi:hypothetical protein
MYQDHIKAIEYSLAQAKNISSIDALSAKMFSLFFEQFPEARGYFKDYDLTKLASVKFNIIVTTIIDTLKYPDFADNYISEEVYRHTIHDLKDRVYYFALIDALIDSLKLTLEQQWSDELQTYWTEATSGMKHSIDRELAQL